MGNPIFESSTPISRGKTFFFSLFIHQRGVAANCPTAGVPYKPGRRWMIGVLESRLSLREAVSRESLSFIICRFALLSQKVEKD